MMLQYLKCMVLTCLASYPFVAVFIQERRSSDYMACSKEEACCFIRYFGTSDLPATTAANIELSSAIIATPAFRGLQWLPMYVSVRNGEDFHAAAPQVSFANSIPLLYACLPAAFSFPLATSVSLPGFQATETQQTPFASIPLRAKEFAIISKSVFLGT